MEIRLVLAVAAVWFLWGSTMAAMRAAVASMPPFVMAGLRFTIAGAILYAICIVRGRARFTRDELVRGFITGAALLLFGNGVTAWTVQFLPSGVTSLLLSCAPIWMAITAYAWGGERPTRLAVVGMVLGLAGLALLLQPKSGGTIAFVPAVISVLASVAWSVGSIYQRRAGHAGSLVLATALQMLCGGALIMLEALVTGEWAQFHPAAVTPFSLAAFAWLVILGSVVSYSAYLYTMRHARTALASTYAYVNPLVALVLGFFVFGERLTPVEVVASAVILAGVALMMVPAKRSVAAATSSG